MIYIFTALCLLAIILALSIVDKKIQNQKTKKTIMKLIYVAVLIAIPIIVALAFALGWLDKIISAEKKALDIIPGLLVVSSILIATGFSLFQSLLAMGMHVSKENNNTNEETDKILNRLIESFKKRWDTITNLKTLKECFKQISDTIEILEKLVDFDLIKITLFITTVVSMFSLVFGSLSLLDPSNFFGLAVMLIALQILLYAWFFFLCFLLILRDEEQPQNQAIKKQEDQAVEKPEENNISS